MARGSLGRVLVTDDEVELMSALVELLNGQGYDAVGRTSGAVALEALREQEFDLLLTDLMMPEMDGITLLQSALAIDPHLVGILMTGQGTVQTAVEAMRVGAFDYLLKPFRLQTLLPVLTRAMQVRRLHLENLALRDSLAVYELGQAVTRSLDLPTILAKLADSALQQCRADEVSLLLPTEDRQELIVAAVGGNQRDHLLGHRQSIDRGPAGWVAQHHEPLLLSGAIQDPQISPARPRAEIQSSLVYPVLYGGKLMGVLCANSMSRYRSLTQGEIKALDLLVSLGAAALENASLYAEAHRAEQIAIEAERQYRGIFENAVEGIYQIRPDRQSVTVNPALARILGYDAPEDIAFASAALAQSYRDPEAHERFLQSATLAEGSSAEFQILDRAGRVKWISERARTVFDSGGELLFYEGCVEDITDRKGAEAALRESEELYRSVVENLSEGIVISSGLTISFVNDAFLKIHGLSDPAEVLGKSRDLLVAPEDRERLRENLLARQRGEQPSASTSYRVVRPDGEERLVEISGHLIVHQGHPAALSVLRDVTVEKRAEDALRQSEERLRQAQKMEAVGQLAGGIAHDFNNLLTAIIGFSDLVHDRIAPDDPNRAFIQEITSAGERAATLTRQLLAFSRQQVLKPRVLDLNTVVAEMNKLLVRVLGADVDLITMLDPTLDAIEADPGQVEQIILNLVVNARDAMPNGGRLILATENVELDESYAGESLDIPPGHYVLLSVSDTGTGMDATTQARIFEPFFTTKEVGKGTGLGLATVFGIVKQSEGSITVASELGQGTTFRIYLPRTERTNQVVDPELPEAAVPVGAETILLVEDEPSVRNLARTVLQSLGYQVFDARHAGEALSLLSQLEGPPDLLLTDLVMPGMSGQELAERLQVRHPNLKVLYMSGFTGEAALHQRRLGDGMHFIQKPFTPLGLARQVRALLDG